MIHDMLEKFLMVSEFSDKNESLRQQRKGKSGYRNTDRNNQ